MGDGYRRVGRSSSVQLQAPPLPFAHRPAMATGTSQPPVMMKPSNGPEPISAQRVPVKQSSSFHLQHPHLAAEEWHGELAGERRSKSVAASLDPNRLQLVNSELQRKLGHTERQLEEERRHYLATIRSLENSLQEHRGHLQDERKVSAALNRDLLNTKNVLAHSQQQQSGTAGLMAAVQGEQIARELKELKSRLDDLQRCASPPKQLNSRQSQEGKARCYFICGLLCVSNG